MDVEFDRLAIEPEQRELLLTMVRADEAIPRERRHPFILVVTGEGADLLHEGLQPGELGVLKADLDVLVRNSLLSIDYGGHGTPNYTVMPEGRRYVGWLMASRGTAQDHIEEDVRRWIDSSAFRERHPQAYLRWEVAESLLWEVDVNHQHTTVGHSCREALQQFASEVVRHFGVEEEADPDVTKTVSRVRTAIKVSGASPMLGQLMDASVVYWGAVNDIAQRQEHGAQKEGEALTIDDSRRLVFHTAFVMYELDRLIAGR